jgi:protein-L-isoaspartate(D-aspartate) O-methyltransferase
MRATRSIVGVAILLRIASPPPSALGDDGGGTEAARRAEGGACKAMDAATADRRTALVDELRRDGIRDEAVLRAIANVPRHALVPQEVVEDAYDDRPLPIGHEQTISQPFVVAYMTEVLEVAPGMRVLEVGTGSGYQAAVLAELGANVRSIEIIPELSRNAAAALAACGYGRVSLRTGDGYAGWPEAAPFDRIIVTAGADEVPPPLLAQLAPRGRLVMPVTEPVTGAQSIHVVDKAENGGVTTRRMLPVRFVPLTGEAERK